MKPERPADVGEYVKLRQNAVILLISRDRLQFAFPNFIVTFQTTEVVEVIQQVIKATKKENEVVKLTSIVSKKTGYEENFVSYVLNQLIQNNCLITHSQNFQPLEQKNDRNLFDFYEYIGDGHNTIKLLQEKKFVIFTPSDKKEECENIFNINGMNPYIISPENDWNTEQYIGHISNSIPKKVELLVCWNFPYKLSTVKAINIFAIENKLPIIFGSCEGIIGHLGPFVIPKNSSCFECMHLRLLSNYNENEQFASNAYRFLEEQNIGISWVSHPGFHNSLLQQLSIEVSRILLGAPSNCLGVFYDFYYNDLQPQRHPVIKIPNCPSCGNKKPTRFAWDHRFPAPIVKNSI